MLAGKANSHWKNRKPSVLCTVQEIQRPGPAHKRSAESSPGLASPSPVGIRLETRTARPAADWEMHASPAPETGFRVDFPSRDAGSAAARAAQKSPMTSSPRPSTADAGRAQIRASQRIGSGAPHRRLAVAVCSAAASVTAAECNVGPTEPSKASCCAQSSTILSRPLCPARTLPTEIAVMRGGPLAFAGTPRLRCV